MEVQQYEDGYVLAEEGTQPRDRRRLSVTRPSAVAPHLSVAARRSARGTSGVPLGRYKRSLAESTRATWSDRRPEGGCRDRLRISD
eukprot:6318909-Pyramimonas_sp.AAC.1